MTTGLTEGVPLLPPGEDVVAVGLEV